MLWITFPDLGEQKVVGYIFASADSDSVAWRVIVIPPEEAADFALSHLRTFALDGPYPNPFNQSSVVSYQLTVAGKVNLSLYDINGRLVGTLVEGWQGAGEHRAEIGGHPGMGVLPTGIYFIRLQAAGQAGTPAPPMVRKAVVIR